MCPNELRQKAAECTRAMGGARSPTQRAMLVRLRRMWIDLADNSRLLDEESVATKVEQLDRVHGELIGPTLH
jgi:hypothetical protein